MKDKPSTGTLAMLGIVGLILVRWAYSSVKENKRKKESKELMLKEFENEGFAENLVKIRALSNAISAETYVDALELMREDVGVKKKLMIANLKKEPQR